MSVTRYLAGMFFALLVMMTGEARADPRVLVDLYPEWQVREACRLMEREGDLPPWWADVCGEPIPPVSPDLPPVSEDDGEEPPLPPSGCWTTPSGQRLCPGEEGRASKLVDGGGNIEWISPRESRPFFTVADLFEAWGMFDTEDGTDDPTPTLDDPSEFVEHNPLGTEYRSLFIEVPPLVLYEPAQPQTPEPTPSETPTAAPVEPTPAACPPGTTPMLGGPLCLDYWTPGGDWRWGLLAEPDLKEACVVEVIDQPVSVENPDGSSAAYLGGCEVETCPGAEPVTTCCTSKSLTGHVVCQTVDPAAELYPYEPPATIWEALEWLLTLPGSGEIPAGYEGPWKFYLYTSATEGR